MIVLDSVRFIEQDGVDLLVSDQLDIAYLVVSGVEQKEDFPSSSLVEVGPRRIVGLRLSHDDVLDLANTLHLAVCPDCSAERRVAEEQRATAAYVMAIDVCRQYAEEHPEHAEAAGQIAMRITQAALKRR